MTRTRKCRARDRRVAWFLAAFGTAATATILGVRYVRAKLDAEAERLANVLNLAPGQVIAEIGAGAGHMSVRIARRLRLGGRIIATEFEPKKLRAIRRSVQRHGVENVAIEQGSETGAELAAGLCDAIFMRGVYHHFTAPAPMNRSLFAALRPGGVLAVIDFAPKLLLSLCPPKGIPANRGGHGIRRPLVEQELRQAGFQVVERWDDWGCGRYCVLFRKPA